MKAEKLIEIIGAEFYTGVPDSLLRNLCDCLINMYGMDPKHHIIAANEGNCTAIAAGYYMATGKMPVVYMQNSGEGNTINPIASLLNEKVYGIPVLFIVGWRGEPKTHDEPQHIFQGEITTTLLDLMGIEHFIMTASTSEDELNDAMSHFRNIMMDGHSAAIVIEKGAISYDKSIQYRNQYEIRREDIIQHITAFSGDDPIVSTTGKASRELFEIREAAGAGHQRDFLTVGSMGHCSSIALGIALQKPDRTVWCIDGDGAVLMHMGAMAVIGSIRPDNLIHVVINNGAHETVGGMPTALKDFDIAEIARTSGYEYAVTVNSLEELDMQLQLAKHRHRLTLIEAKCAIGAREDLGRPTTTAMENRIHFESFLRK